MPAVLHPDDISEWRSVDTHWNWLYIRATLIGGVTNLQRFVVEFGMAKLRSVKRSSPKVYEFTVSLVGTSPMVWRRFLAHEIINLDELHMLIQMTMGWDASHLYEFQIEKKKYASSEHADDPEAESAEDFALKDVVEGARKFSYLYDFGDRWIHEIEITNVLEHDPTRIYPVCVAGENACPPENCGGPLGFEELKEVLSGKASEEKADCLEGLGGFYYPFSFDPNFVNRYLLWADSESAVDSDEFDV